MWMDQLQEPVGRDIRNPWHAVVRAIRSVVGPHVQCPRVQIVDPQDPVDVDAFAEYCSIDGPDLSRACRGEASPVAFLGLVVAAVLVAAVIVRRGAGPGVLGAEDETRSLAS